LYDAPPRYADLGVPDGTSIVYVAAPSTHSSHIEEFARAVESYARVVEIQSGQEVDLEDAKKYDRVAQGQTYVRVIKRLQ